MEVWSPIDWLPGLPAGVAEVSSLGRVRTLPRVVEGRRSSRAYPGQLLTPRKDRKGYLKAGIWYAGTGRYVYVHRLVAGAFIANPAGKRGVNHKNGIKADNRVENLEWATDGENMRHSVANGMHIPNRGSANGSATLTEGGVVEIRRRRAAGETLQSLATAFGVSMQMISRICLRQKWAHVA